MHTAGNVTLLLAWALLGVVSGEAGRGAAEARAQAPGDSRPGQDKGRSLPIPPEPSEKDKLRKDYDKNCLRSGCHAGLVARTWVHGPAAVAKCGACHKAAKGRGEHRFELCRTKKKLCTFCHEIPGAQAVVHEAYRNRDCLACHDPHGGDSRRLLRDRDEGKLCAGECHDPRVRQPKGKDPKGGAYKWIHDPVAKGQCLVCHTAHQSENKALLVAPEKEACLGCHTKLHDAFASAKHIHDHTSEECLPCHLPHAGDKPRLLRASPPALCVGCHESIGKLVARKAVFHGASEREDYCLACHEAHVATSEAILKDPVSKGCFECHDREITSRSGRKIANVKAAVTNSKSRHGPGVQGNCSACHRGHTSQYRAFLKSEYPVREYVEYTDKAYALCYSCHDKRIITEERSTLTGFRDGDRNLHYVHVHKVKGRACSLCHEAHGSARDKLIRSKGPFGPGTWKLRLDFRKTPGGGTCVFGCHQELSYNNNSPPPDPAAAHSALLESRAAGPGSGGSHGSEAPPEDEK